MKVAGHGFDPCIGHTNERLPEIFVAEADGLKHGARAGAVATVSDEMTAVFWIHKSKSLRQSWRKRKQRELFRGSFQPI